VSSSGAAQPPSDVNELIHEMRNELAVARANLEGLVDGKLAPTRERLLGIIQALSQLDGLIDDVRALGLDVAMPVRAGHINVCELLNREYGAMDAIARVRGVTVTINRCEVPAAQCLHFIGDAGRIGQIVKNVLLNAIRYTPKGGAVTIDCARRADQLEVRIADTGPGFEGDESERVFDPGFRGAAARETDGSGYGLAVVKQLVEAQGGTVTAAGTSAGGATFTVRLPGAGPDDTGLCSSCGLARTGEPPTAR
jgi:two-component system, OmpR family, sensor histidine kinase BaeS